MPKWLFAVFASMTLSGIALAEGPVYFPDPYLKAEVEEELWISDPTPADMLGLTHLVIPTGYSRKNAIRDITGLDYAVNLVELNLRYHEVSDISPLAGLVNLRSLNLLGNGISDLSPLSNLIHLESLDLELNAVSDISALAGLADLTSLCLHRNMVSDISPLTALRSLTWLDLRALPLSLSAYDTYLPQIEANNPGITILYDAFFVGELVISSTIGGTVISPGEGTFATVFGESWSLQAKADPGFAFAGWSGSCSTTANPLSLTIDQDYVLQANFVSTLPTIHVDDNGPADPGPNDPVVCDPEENGTSEHPFDSIRKAIDVAPTTGTTIFVHTGVYRENIDLLGKRIALTGFDPNAPQVAAWPILDGRGSGPMVSFIHGEDESCLLTGFVITGGKAKTGAAIRCTGSSPTIAHCLIAGNRAAAANGAAIVCADSNAIFVNCTIVENRGGPSGAALSTEDGQVAVLNSILWNNWPVDIAEAGDSQPTIHYSVVKGAWPGPGNCADNPLFADVGRWVDHNDPTVTVTSDAPDAIWYAGDYHVQSQVGRWEPTAGDWTHDTATSPCIDGGDPTVPVGFEPLPNGGIINMGAYGGTNEASRSYSWTPSP